MKFNFQEIGNQVSVIELLDKLVHEMVKDSCQRGVGSRVGGGDGWGGVEGVLGGK